MKAADTSREDLLVTHHLMQNPHVLVLSLSDGTDLQCTPCDSRTLQELEITPDAELNPVRLVRDGETLMAFHHEQMQGHRKDEAEGYVHEVMQAAADYCQVKIRCGIYTWEPGEGSGDMGHLIQYIDGYDCQDAQAMLLVESYMRGDDRLPDDAQTTTLTLACVDVLLFHDFLYSRYLQARQEYLMAPSRERLQVREGAAAAFDRLQLALGKAGYPILQKEFVVEETES